MRKIIYTRENWALKMIIPQKLIHNTGLMKIEDVSANTK